MIWNELGVSGGTALIVLCALYFVIKWAVRNGIREAHQRMNGEKEINLGRAFLFSCRAALLLFFIVLLL